MQLVPLHRGRQSRGPRSQARRRRSRRRRAGACCIFACIYVYHPPPPKPTTITTVERLDDAHLTSEPSRRQKANSLLRQLPRRSHSHHLHHYSHHPSLASLTLTPSTPPTIAPPRATCHSYRTPRGCTAGRRRGTTTSKTRCTWWGYYTS
jgi:hypothetical protein